MSDLSYEVQPVEKRWDPIGASSETYENNFELHEAHKIDELKILERDKEKLSSSLFALTTHFAQVQFRLRQVIHAPPEAKENLLQSLEEFASQGIPEIEMLNERKDGATLMTEIYLRRQQQKKVFSVLKKQLSELQEYALRNNQENAAFQQHRVVLSELKSEIKLNFNENINKGINNNSMDEVVVTSVEMKEQFVNQLKEQIADLESYVNYLQSKMKEENQFKMQPSQGVIQKLASALEIFTTVQFGCIYKQFRKDKQNLKTQIEDYTLFKSKLDQSISKVKRLIATNQNETKSVNFNIKLTKLVRKTLAVSLNKLIQHGTRCPSSSVLIPFSICCLRKSSFSNDQTQIHAWEILLKFIEMQEKKEIKPLTAATNLLKSYNLVPLNSSEISTRDELSWCVKNIISMNEPYRKDPDSHFKAFVCTALNAGKLAFWIKLIFSDKQLIKTFYRPWSYVAKTHFQDSLENLDSLATYKLNLMVDIAVRHFQNIKDVFY